MIWFVILDLFIISAAVGGERWLGKTIAKMTAFFVMLMIARAHTGAAFVMGTILLSAAGAVMLARADQRKKRTHRGRTAHSDESVALSNN